MRQTAHFSEKPAEIMIYVVDGKATDVWIRKNIREEPAGNTDTEEFTAEWIADEVYGRLGKVLTEEEVKADLESYYSTLLLWENNPDAGRSTAKRIENLEKTSSQHDLALMELAALITEGL